MTLVLTLNSGPIWQHFVGQLNLPVIENLQNITVKDSSQLFLSAVQLAQVQQLLQQHNQVVLLYNSPEQQLAGLLAEGSDSSQALSSWLQSCTELLALHKQWRRQLTLVNLSELENCASAGLAMLQRFGLNVNESASTCNVTLYDLVARQLLRQNSDAWSQYQLLQASTLILNDNRAAIDTDRILVQFSSMQSDVQRLQQQLITKNEECQQQYVAAQLQQQSINKLQQDVKTMQDKLATHSVQLEEKEQENGLLLEQLMQVQEELERYYLANKDKEQEINKLQQQLMQSNQEKQALFDQHTELMVNYEASHVALSSSEQTVQQLRLEKQQLLHNQKQTARELARVQQKSSSQRAELASAKYQLEQSTQQLNALKGSTSWKIAAPVRVLSRVVKKTDKNRQRLQQEMGLLFTSELFDAEWYLQTYPDVAEQGTNPAEHYLKFGAAEGRQPSAEFNGNWYLERYPDVAASGVNPLLHYIKFGRNEGRTASPKLLENHHTPLQG